MRPRLFAAEIGRAGENHGGAGQASMRPRLFAAEIKVMRQSEPFLTKCFNEAAAFRRGNRSFRYAAARTFRLASMRPRLFAAEIVLLGDANQLVHLALQ